MDMIAGAVAEGIFNDVVALVHGVCDHRDADILSRHSIPLGLKGTLVQESWRYVCLPVDVLWVEGHREDLQPRPGIVTILLFQSMTVCQEAAEGSINIVT